MSNPQYLVRHDNGRVFVYSEILARRADMIQAMDLDEAHSLSASEDDPAKSAESTDDDNTFVISKATKDELVAVAREQYGVDLDRRKSVDTLRQEVLALAE